MKKLYRKYLIWYYGKFKDRITRCNHCTFLVFKNEPGAYVKMIRHNLYYCRKLTPQQQVEYINDYLFETQNRLIKILSDNLDRW